MNTSGDGYSWRIVVTHLRPTLWDKNGQLGNRGTAPVKERSGTGRIAGLCWPNERTQR
jgi:hypothetical protein